VDSANGADNEYTPTVVLSLNPVAPAVAAAPTTAPQTTGN